MLHMLDEIPVKITPSACGQHFIAPLRMLPISPIQILGRTRDARPQSRTPVTRSLSKLFAPWTGLGGNRVAGLASHAGVAQAQTVIRDRAEASSHRANRHPFSDFAVRAQRFRVPYHCFIRVDAEPAIHS